jgi:dTDP-4-amino-4,6-dideoxygalactose transaminase
MKVPFVDLYTQYIDNKIAIDKAIETVIKETSFIKGHHVKQFEENFAKAFGIKHCIGVANGTDAIYIVLKMLGIGEGYEVITAGISWISTSETITQAGATPVFVDIDPLTYTINPDLIEEKITKKTKAIIPVHLYGQAADLDPIMALCKKYNLILIEDCAQSHFAEYNNQFVGTFGMASTFSFYPGKNLGAYGDAGAIITNDDQLAEKCRMYSSHGALTKHHHLMEGINSRLDGLQAAILNVKLPKINEWNKRRLANAMYYAKILSNINEIKIPSIRENSFHIFHVFCIRAERRNELQQYLKDNGIETAIHYPVALPNMPAYKYRGYKPDDFPVASAYQEQILSLPMFPELSKEQMDYTVFKIKEFYQMK